MRRLLALNAVVLVAFAAFNFMPETHAKARNQYKEIRDARRLLRPLRLRKLDDDAPSLFI